MIPVLYESTATTFINNGLGRLSDVISCDVEEERNGKYELVLEYPVGGAHFDEITHSRIIFAIPADGKAPQPFRIYGITIPIDGKITVYAEHVSYQLSHIPVNPFGQQTAVAQALQGLKSNAAETCPFEFWTDKTSTGTFQVKEPKSIRALLGGTQGSILDAFGGGEYEWDGYTVKLYQHRGTDNGVVLRYGKNITDIEQEEAIDSTITGVYPFWKGTVNDQEVLVTLTEKVLHHSSAANYPFQRTATLDCSSQFQNQPTEAQLRSYATSYMNNNGIGVPKVSITVEFQPLWQTEEYKDIANLERVNLCDTVTVLFEKLGITASAKVVRTKYDVLKERYEEIELGDAKTKLADSVKSSIKAEVDANAAQYQQLIDNAKSFLQSELDALEAQISSANDGNIVFTYDANGNRTQILAMDTQDIQTANKILVINYQGIGGYTGGYSSANFQTAITTDGKVIAESITAGTLKAALILGNVLKVGGSGTGGDGVIEVYDVNNNLVGQWDKNKLLLTGDWEISGWEFPASAANDPYWKVVMKYTDVDISGTSEFRAAYDQFYPYLYAYGNTTWKMLEVFTQNKRTGEKEPGIQLIAHQHGGCVLAASEGVGSSQASDGTYIEDYSSPTRISVHKNAARNAVVTLSEIMKNDYVQYRILSDAVDQIIRLGKWISGGVWYTGIICGPLEATDVRIMHNGRYLAYATSSSRRYKHNIKPLSGAHKLLNLPVVEFEWNDDHKLQYEDMRGMVIPGIIAEDVDEIYPSAVIHDRETGEVESWDERRIIPGMLALIQEQDAKIKSLEARLEKLERLLK